MWVQRAADGFLFGGLTQYAVETLRGVPMLLESTDPRVQSRLLPETYAEREDEEQWRRHALPELERLFLSRAQLLRRDLSSLRQVPGTDGWLLLVADSHCNAWLSSLNAARLALFLLSDLTAEHMERDGFLAATEKQQEALLRIHFLAEIQSVLLVDIEIDAADAGEIKPPPAG